MLVALCAMFACACAFSVPSAYADELGDSFMVAAAQQDGTYVLEPTSVSYREGDTVQEALERADVGMEFTQAGTIERIAGVKPTAGMYLYSFTDYDSRESVMLNDIAASSITALFVSSADVDGIGQGHVDLLNCMRTYLVRTDGLRNYPDAKSAYERARDSLPGATNAQAAVIAADFAQAIEAYDAYMACPKNTVTFKVTRAGKAVDDAQIAMIDLYGNMTKAKRTGSGTYKADVVPGLYAYQAMAANGLDGVRNTMMGVTGDAQETVELPDEEWFDTVTLRVKNDDPDKDCSTGKTSAADRVVENIVPDAALSEADVAVYAVPADAIYDDRASYPLYTVYTGTDGEDRTEQIAYLSKTFRPPYLIDSGTGGAEYTYEVRHSVGSSPLKYQVEICQASIVRSPTLLGLSVRDGAMELISNFGPYVKTYEIDTSADELVFAPEPRGTEDEGYIAQVNGTAASADNPVTIAVNDSARTTPQIVRVRVALDGRVSWYQVKINKVDASTVTIAHDADVSVKVRNEAGTTVKSMTAGTTADTYKLLAGHTYTYVATKGEYFHATGSFTAANGSTVQAATPPTVDAIESFKLGQDNLWGNAATAKPLFEQAEGSTVHDQRFLVPDSWSSQSWLRAYPVDASKAEGYSYQAKYARQDTGASVTSAATSFKPTLATEGGANVLRISGGLQGFTTESGYSNTAAFTVTTGIDPATGAVLTQDYSITAVRVLTLPAISVSDGKNTLKMAQGETADSDSPTYGFDRNVRDYTIAVAEGTESLQVRFTFSRPISDKALGAGGYAVVVDGKETAYEAGATKVQDVELDPDQHEQVIPVIVRHADSTTPDQSYRLKVQLMPKVPVKFDVTPADASVTVTDPVTGLRLSAGEDGSFDLISGYEYDYTVAARGYVGQHGTFMAHDGLETKVVLAAAPINPTIDTGLTSHWPYFRADADNNGVIDAKTPIPGTGKTAGASGGSGTALGTASVQGADDADNGAPSKASATGVAAGVSGSGLTAAVPKLGAQAADSEVSDEPLLYWASQLGEGYDSGAAGCPILVDGYLYTYAGDKIYRVDTVTGETVASGTMVGTSSFAITPMTYAEGMVFVALSNGRVEAFNAATLESLWVYTSPNGGQPNSPITYHDGCIYTGFWNWSNICDFVCLSVTDEDPTSPGSAVVDDPDHPGRTKSAVLDAKVALWSMQHEGGFYWAGAWAGDDYVIVGSDNAGISAGLDVDQEGNATGTLFSIDPITGEVIDTLNQYKGATNIGNIRSTVVRDAETGKFYFCGRAGYLCEVSVNADGTFDKGSARAIKLKNDASDGAISATSTPVVYNGRAYVGADHGSYNAYDGQCIDVVDLATGSVAYTVQMQGRAQTSGLLTTGYLDDDGYVYIYYFDNYYPGKLRCFKDKPGQTSAVDTSTETDDRNHTYSNMANVVFCPKGAQAQYCICSPIADEYGTIYFKNDSSYTMALGSPITKLEVVDPPTVTQYGVGEVFEPAGMKVVATYANGATRDVTDYVEVTDEAFEAEGVVDVPIVFPYTMYQSGPGTDDIGAAPDYNFPKPSTTVRVTVGSEVPPRLTATELPHAMVAPDISTDPIVPYEVTLTATGAPRDFAWTCEGSLPAGLAFATNDDGTATISGEPAKGSGGAYPLKVKCANSVGSAETDLTLEVYEIPKVTATSSVLPAVTGQPFSYQVQASGYPKPIVYALQEGFVHRVQGWTSHTPEGLSIDADTGLISGTPLEPIDPAQYRTRVYASNAAGIGVPVNLRISVTGESMIYPGAPEIVTETIGHALAEAETGYVTVGEQVSIPVEVTGDPAPTVTVEGLPDGLAYDADAGAIVGAAALVDEGGAKVTVHAENGQGPAVERSYALYVYEPPATSVDEWAGALYNEPYEQQLDVTGAPAPNVIVTGLASGLHYDKAEGKVYGTPKMKGTFKVSVTATNAAGSFTKTYQLVVGAAPAIGVYALPDALEGAAYTAPLKVSGEPAPEVTVEGLPAGLAYDATNGVIGGTTSEVGAHEVRVVASNGVGEDAEKTFTLVVRESFEMLTEELPIAICGEGYSQVLEFSKPFESAASATVKGLPTELESAVDAEAGTITISGTPSVANEAGYTLAVSATSAGGTSLSKELVLVVEPAEKAVSMRESATLIPWEKDAQNSVDLAKELQVAGRPSAFDWKVGEGSLPAGVALSSEGVLSGAPTAAGAYTFQVVCSNDLPSSAQALVSLLVSGSPSYGELSIPVGKVGSAYSASVATAYAHPSPTYSWRAVSGSTLPPGLTLSSSTGVISGTCTQRGVFDVEVIAENEGGIASERVAIVVKQDIADAEIGDVAGQVYDGRAHEPAVVVYAPEQGGSGAAAGELAAGSARQELVLGVDYTLSYSNNVNAGTATVTVNGAGLYTGSVVREFTIAKAAQPLSVSAKAAKVKYKKVKKKAQKLAVGKALVVRGAQGKVTCKLSKIKTKKKLAKQAKKKIKLAANGAITLKKKLKKGTYKLTVQVTADGDANYNAGSKSVVVKVVVK